MDIAKWFSDMAIATEEMQKPMTLEEAVELMDPDPLKQNDWPDSLAAARAKEMKARMMVVNYMREHLGMNKKEELDKADQEN